MVVGGKGGGEGGGWVWWVGEWRWLVKAQNSVPLAALSKQQSLAAIGFLDHYF